MKTNLIITEGLPGSGKSTLSLLISEKLKSEEIPVVYADEGTLNHPADYGNYDFPDFQTERKKILEKWRSFVENAEADTVYVFNCIFLQNPITEAMFRFNRPEEEIRSYIREIADVIRSLNPAIVYIDEPDPEKRIREVLDERGEDWLKAVVDYHTGQSYGTEHHLSGFDGYLQALLARKDLEKKILRDLDFTIFPVTRKDGTGLQGFRMKTNN